MPSLTMVALVGVGGALGSVARYLLSIAVQRTVVSLFPFGTFLVNVIGCLIFGAIAAAGEGRLSATGRAFLLAGVLGGFTTFSSFGYETFDLLRDGRLGLACLYVGASVVVGLAALWTGYTIARAI